MIDSVPLELYTYVLHNAEEFGCPKLGTRWVFAPLSNCATNAVSDSSRYNLLGTTPAGNLYILYAN